MEITEVNILAVKPQDGLIAFANIVISNSLYLGSIAVYTRPDGTYRLLYPAKKVGDRLIDTFHPISREMSKRVEDAVFKKCEDIFERRNEDDRYNQNTSNTTRSA